MDHYFKNELIWRPALEEPLEGWPPELASKLIIANMKGARGPQATFFRHLEPAILKYKLSVARLRHLGLDTLRPDN